jgi:DNA-damage-inducible protein J
MSTINIRIDEKLKKQARKTLASIGMDTSSAVKVFLTQVVKEKGLPFKPTSDLGAIRARWDKEVA